MTGEMGQLAPYLIDQLGQLELGVDDHAQLRVLDSPYHGPCVEQSNLRSLAEAADANQK